MPLRSLDTAEDVPPANGSSDRGMPGVADVTATRAASPRTATALTDLQLWKWLKAREVESVLGEEALEEA